MIIRKLIAGLTALCTAFSMLPPISASAEESEANNMQEPLSNVSVSAGNSLAKLLESQISVQNETVDNTENTEPLPCSVSGINLENGYAEVGFNTDSDASLIVGLYSEDTGEMLASASAGISPDMVNVTLDFDSMPDGYFIVRGYIVDTQTLEPLSEVYENLSFTQLEQEFYSLMPSDFDSERVLQFTEQSVPDFAVFDEGTKMISYSEGMNILTVNDNENGFYRIENADDNVLSLSEGDCFAMYYGDDLPLITQVGSIESDGSTVEITAADDIAIDSIFEFIRIDENALEPEYNEDVLYEDTEIIGQQDNEKLLSEPPKYGSTSNSGSINFTYDNSENVHSVSYKKTIKVPMEKQTKKKPFTLTSFWNSGKTEIENEFKPEGTITFSVSAGVKISFNKSGKGKFYADFNAGSELTPDFTLKGSSSVSIPLTKVPIDIPTPVTGLYVSLCPKIELEANAELSANVTVSNTLKYGYDGTKPEGSRCFSNSNTSVLKGGITIDGSLYFGINLNPKLCFISEKIFAFNMKKCCAGVEITGTLFEKSAEIKYDGEKGKTEIDYSGKTEHHLCDLCIDGEIKVKFEISLQVDILILGSIFKKSEHKTEPLFTVNIPSIHLKYFYVRLASKNQKAEIKWGKCTNREFLCNVHVSDSDTLAPVAYAPVFVSRNGEEYTSGITNDKGVTEMWLRTDENEFQISANDCEEKTSTHSIKYRSKADFGTDEKYDLYIDSKKTTDLYLEIDSQKYPVEVNIVDANGELAPDSRYFCSYSCDTLLGSIVHFVKAPLAEINKLVKNPQSDTLMLPNGTFKISASADGYIENEELVTVDGQPTSVTIVLEEGYFCQFEAKDQNGNAIDNAEVRITRSDDPQKYDRTFMTDENGMLTVHLDSREYDVVISKKGYDTYMDSIFVPSVGLAKYCEMQCRLHSVMVSVRDSSGNPIKDAKIINSYDSTKTFTDSTGTASLVLVEGLNTLKITKSDYLDKSASIVVSDKNDNTLDVIMEEEPLGVTWSFADGVLTISGKGDMERFSSVYNIPWYSIREEISKIIIEDGVTSISDQAFWKCTNLISIDIPDSINKIGKKVFYECYSLEKAEIPYGVKEISSYLFMDCDSLSAITIPDSVTGIEKGAFYGCCSLKEINLPNRVHYIADEAFRFCSSIESIVIPPKVKSINSSTFQICSNLSSITLPDTLLSIEGWAFAGCTKLSEINIPETVNYIGARAFSECAALTEINIPYGVKAIYDCTFQKCENLINVSIPDGVTSIGSDAFWHCRNLTSILIPDGVTSIGNDAFAGCNSLTSITLPDSVTSIGQGAFSACLTLKEISLPDGITKISDSAFFNCDSITSISIPDSVTSIEFDAFAGCDSLTSITLPDSVTSIGKAAFEYCKSLTSISIPDSVTEIGNDAFYKCDNLKDVYYSGSEQEWKTIAESFPKNATIHYNSTALLPSAPQLLSEYRADNAFETLPADTLFNIYVMRDRNAAEPLSPGNLLYITQAYTDSEGCLPSNAVCGSFDDAVTFAVCYGDGEEDPTEPALECIDITEMHIGDKLPITVPENATLLISDKSVADINEGSKIEALAEGKAVIASIADNEMQIIAVVRVLSDSSDFGDVNLDGSINPVDATLTLQQYTANASGGDSILDADQMKRADVNGDGAVNPVDATNILRYYTSKASGNEISFDVIR